MSMSLKVMVVDDSLTYRIILKRIIDDLAGTELIAMAANGKIALAKIAESHPDLVLMDVTMPVMDGMAALKRIRAEFPSVQVVMVSSFQRDYADIVIECLAAGALEFVTKPVASQGVATAAEDLRQALIPILNVVVARLLVQRGRVRKPPTSPAARKPVVPTPAVRISALAKTEKSALKPAISGLHKAELLLIGSSTGGPVALSSVLKEVGPRLEIPILLVQHMPPLFTASLASQLQRSTGIQVREALHGDALTPGTALLAPGGRHMTFENKVGRGVIALNDDRKVNGCRPAVDVLFSSVAERFSGRILAVVLTGMGQDGANGVAALKHKGRCACIVQDEASCVVFGMPRAVNERGLADEMLPLGAIGSRIRQLCG